MLLGDDPEELSEGEGGMDRTASTTPRWPRRVDLSTSDPELAHEWLREDYTEYFPRLSGDRQRFRLRQTSTGDDHFSVRRLRHSLTMDTGRVAPFPFLLVGVLQQGRYQMIDDAGAELDPERGELFLWPQSTQRFHTEDFQLGMVQLDTDRVRRIAAELGCIEPEALAFLRSRPVSLDWANHFRAVARHVAREVLPSETVMGSKLARSEAFRMLATALLHTFPNTALDAELTLSGEHVEPAALRRAVEFIESHAGDDIGVAEIAAASRLGVRSLQQAFRRHRDTSPLAYLRRVRLAAAHRDLQASDPTRGDTVRSVAVRWGFTNPGRFAAAYRQRYGHSPTRTLDS